jgi:hypothetical protein
MHGVERDHEDQQGDRQIDAEPDVEDDRRQRDQEDREDHDDRRAESELSSQARPDVLGTCSYHAAPLLWSSRYTYARTWATTS